MHLCYNFFNYEYNISSPLKFTLHPKEIQQTQFNLNLKLVQEKGRHIQSLESESGVSSSKSQSVYQGVAVGPESILQTELDQNRLQS